jgi:hypothetical protein
MQNISFMGGGGCLKKFLNAKKIVGIKFPMHIIKITMKTFHKCIVTIQNLLKIEINVSDTVCLQIIL